LELLQVKIDHEILQWIFWWWQAVGQAAQELKQRLPNMAVAVVRVAYVVQ
jgi:hypothetical protein